MYIILCEKKKYYGKATIHTITFKGNVIKELEKANYKESGLPFLGMPYDERLSTFGVGQVWAEVTKHGNTVVTQWENV